MNVTTELVRELIRRQFPQWSRLAVVPVEKQGHDNRTFRLGEEMTVRLPSHERYAPAVEKEMRWLPVFKPRLSLPIPVPIAKGEPTHAYPLPWTVNRWLEGEPVSRSNISDMKELAADLASFLKELQAIDASSGPAAGAHNFHRGGNLAVYDSDTRSVIERVASLYNSDLLTEIWEQALAATYAAAPLWVHGDVAVGNLLAAEGRLCGVIDFGTMGVGDPACDLVIAWNFLDRTSRAVFWDKLGVEDSRIDRARGWALWKALITCDQSENGSEASEWGKRAIEAIVDDVIY